MSSRVGPRAAGSDGADFQHRERVASHYQTSAANKGRLRYIIYLHFMIALLMLIRLTPSILPLLNVAVPEFVGKVDIPAAKLWEYAWMTSLIPDVFGLIAIRRNRASLLKQFSLGIVALGLLPLVCGMVTLVPELLDFWKTGETSSRIMGFPMVLLWNMFAFIALQLHIFTLILCYSLVNAWTVKKKSS